MLYRHLCAVIEQPAGARPAGLWSLSDVGVLKTRQTGAGDGLSYAWIVAAVQH
jgi:hypothetical protein